MKVRRRLRTLDALHLAVASAAGGAAPACHPGPAVWPRVAAAIERVPEDPRFSPQPGPPFRLRSMLRMALLGSAALAGTASAVASPAAARARMVRLADRYERQTTAPPGLATMKRLNFIEHIAV